MTHRHQDPFRDSLEDWDGEYPEAFLPKPGEILVGQLVRYERGSTSYGPADIAVVLDEDSGQERSVWLLHEVLRREFREQLPRPGERIGLKRLEDGRNQHGQKYQKWALRVDRKGGGAPRFIREAANPPDPSGGERGAGGEDAGSPFGPIADPEELEARAADLRDKQRFEDDGLPF